MRIIHTGDLHLDGLSEPYTLKKDPFRVSSSQRWRTFQRLISYANDIEADLLLVCGDLFHRPPTLNQLKEADALFAALECTQVVIIAGNHDYLSPDTPMSDFSWCEQVTLLSTDLNSQVYFPSLNAIIHGFSYTTFQIRDGVYDHITAPNDKLWHILMIHGGDADHLPLHFTALEQSGFDYVALGHIHKPQIFPGKQMAYCGSLEPLDQTETGNHGFMQIDTVRESVQLSFIPFSHTRFIPLSLRVTPEDTLYSLRQTLSERFMQGSSGDVYSVTFLGQRDPELALNIDAFADLSPLYEVLDNTSPWYDFPVLLRQHGSDLIGQYIRSFLSPGSSAEDLDPVQRQALYAGLQALLSSTPK